MPSLHIHGASGADVHLVAGWTGVVGATRADELAFLRLVTGDTVVREPDDAIVRRCAARVDAIAAALAATADVLIVDDGERHPPDQRAAVIAALRDHRGVGLVASGDRALLDELTTATVRVAGAGIRLYAGGYAVARAAWQAEGEARGRERAAGTRQQARLAEQGWLATRDAERTRAAAQRVRDARVQRRTSSRGK